MDVISPVSSAEDACPKHPDFPRVGTCSRCGAFICVRCEPDMATTNQPRCGDCRQRAESADRAKKIPDLEREIFRLLVAYGIVVGGLFSIPVLFLGLGTRGLAVMALGFLILAAPLAGGLIGLGVVYRITHRDGVAWAGVVVSLVATAVFLIVIGLGLNLLTLLFLLMPIVLAHKLSGLSEHRKAAAKLVAAAATPDRPSEGAAGEPQVIPPAPKS